MGTDGSGNTYPGATVHLGMVQLNTGVFLGSIKSNDEFRQGILEAKYNKGKGIIFFAGKGLNDDYAAIINEMKTK